MPARRRSASDPRQAWPAGHRPKKKFGQHFLCDPATAERIVALGEISAGDTVVEIGPGLGVLSDLIAHSARRTILVEIDVELANHLAGRYRDETGATIVNQDFLRVDLAAILAGAGRAVAVGNLPYNVATAIVARLVEQRAHFRRMVLMLQREVAQRIVAAPGTRAYGALSVLTQVYCDGFVALEVPADCFAPKPKVESAVIVLDPLAGPRVPLPDPQRFTRIVRGLFQHRRKQLGNAARGFLQSPVDTLRAAGIDPTRRPETLSIEEFGRLAEMAR